MFSREFEREEVWCTRVVLMIVLATHVLMIILATKARLLLAEKQQDLARSDSAATIGSQASYGKLQRELEQMREKQAYILRLLYTAVIHTYRFI